MRILYILAAVAGACLGVVSVEGFIYVEHHTQKKAEIDEARAALVAAQSATPPDTVAAECYAAVLAERQKETADLQVEADACQPLFARSWRAFGTLTDEIEKQGIRAPILP